MNTMDAFPKDQVPNITEAPHEELVYGRNSSLASGGWEDFKGQSGKATTGVENDSGTGEANRTCGSHFQEGRKRQMVLDTREGAGAE
jgi:hypothetical protein